MYISVTLTTYDPMTFSFFYFSQHPKLGHDGVIPQGIFEQERGFLIEFYNTTLPPSCSNIPFKSNKIYKFKLSIIFSIRKVQY